MLPPRFRKVIRDLTSNKGRTVLVVLAIAVGVFAFGSVFITQDLLLKNINDSYESSNPSTITFNLSNFDASLVAWVKTQKGVKDASGKALQTVKIERSEGIEDILTLESVPDFSKMNLNILIPQKGSWPPQKGEIVLERNSFSGGKFRLGDVLSIKTFQDKTSGLVISGTVYDNSSVPYIFTKQMTGYISWETLGFLGYSKKYNSLEIATTQDIKTLDDAEKFTNQLKKNLKDRGVVVKGTRVSKPNQHWATDNSKAFTAILTVIGSFSLILSGFLVVNTISALLAQQKKQIGIMKAIGAKQKQVTSLYLLTVGFYGILALFIALPIGMLLGYFFLKLVADFLNLDINTFYLPASVFGMELVASLVVPIIAAIIPIVQGARKSVRVALSDYQPAKKVGLVDQMLVKITGLSRPTLLSLRNVFRKSGRLALTLGTLVVAGALFMAVINVRTGMFKEMDRILSMYDFQVSISLPQDYETQSIERRLLEIPKVTAVEARTHVSAVYIKKDGTKSVPFDITGLPANTLFSHPVMLSGRWLKTSDKDGIVLSSAFVRDYPEVSVGDVINVEIANDKYKFPVVGVVSMSGGGGEAKETFANFSSVSRYKDTPNLASGYLVKTTPSDPATQDLVAKNIVDRLKTSGITVAFKQTKNDIITSAASQFSFMIFFLLAMAVMVAIVGGLGLAGTMSLNVLERTREIGIMRSIGANDTAIRKLVLTEGMLVGLISFLLAIPISLPLTYGFCWAIGNAFFGRTIVFAVVPAGILIWFLIVLVLAIIASLVPAGRASKMSISQTLSYE